MKIRIKLLVLFIIVGIGAAIAINMGLFENDDPPEHIKTQIEALETTRYEVTSVKDTGELYKIQMNLLEIPSDKTVESWARAICEKVNLILRGESITRDISVKIYVPIGGKTKYYGEIYYDASRFYYEYIRAD